MREGDEPSLSNVLGGFKATLPLVDSLDECTAIGEELRSKMDLDMCAAQLASVAFFHIMSTEQIVNFVKGCS